MFSKVLGILLFSFLCSGMDVWIPAVRAASTKKFHCQAPSFSEVRIKPEAMGRIIEDILSDPDLLKEIEQEVFEAAQEKRDRDGIKASVQLAKFKLHKPKIECDNKTGNCHVVAYSDNLKLGAQLFYQESCDEKRFSQLSIKSIEELNKRRKKQVQNVQVRGRKIVDLDVQLAKLRFDRYLLKGKISKITSSDEVTVQLDLERKHNDLGLKIKELENQRKKMGEGPFSTLAKTDIDKQLSTLQLERNKLVQRLSRRELEGRNGEGKILDFKLSKLSKLEQQIGQIEKEQARLQKIQDQELGIIKSRTPKDERELRNWIRSCEKPKRVQIGGELKSKKPVKLEFDVRFTEDKRLLVSVPQSSLSAEDLVTKMDKLSLSNVSSQIEQDLKDQFTKDIFGRSAATSDPTTAIEYLLVDRINPILNQKIQRKIKKAIENYVGAGSRAVLDYDLDELTDNTLIQKINGHIETKEDRSGKGKFYVNSAKFTNGEYVVVVEACSKEFDRYVKQHNISRTGAWGEKAESCFEKNDLSIQMSLEDINQNLRMHFENNKPYRFCKEVMEDKKTGNKKCNSIVEVLSPFKLINEKGQLILVVDKINQNGSRSFVDVKVNYLFPNLMTESGLLQKQDVSSNTNGSNFMLLSGVAATVYFPPSLLLYFISQEGVKAQVKKGSEKGIEIFNHNLQELPIHLKEVRLNSSGQMVTFYADVKHKRDSNYRLKPSCAQESTESRAAQPKARPKSGYEKLRQDL